jgi:protein gp37
MLVEHLLDEPLHWATPVRIFVSSMSDPFHPGVPPDWIARMWAVMSLAHWHHFQLLTKRTKRRNQFQHRPMLAEEGCPG